MPEASGDRIPFLSPRGLATVRVKINGVGDFVLLVDTGAEQSVVSRRVAKRLAIDLSKPLRMQPLVGIGGGSTTPVV
jgi:predicted aspartyl protease